MHSVNSNSFCPPFEIPVFETHLLSHTHTCKHTHTQTTIYTLTSSYSLIYAFFTHTQILFFNTSLQEKRKMRWVKEKAIKYLLCNPYRTGMRKKKAVGTLLQSIWTEDKVLRIFPESFSSPAPTTPTHFSSLIVSFPANIQFSISFLSQNPV